MGNLSEYRELYHYDNKRSLVRNELTGDVRMMKILSHYDESVYAYLYAHPEKHIPKIYEFFKDGYGNLIVVEEFIQGNTFDVLISDSEMPDKTKLSYFLEMLEGLVFLHSAPNPIIHRDLKPANIMVTEKGEVKILDYDAAKIYKPDSSGDTTYLGTDGVAAPEQYGFMQSDPRSDVYAVGRMLAAAFPKNARIQQIAAKATTFDPNGRYNDARELSDVLSRRISPTLKLKPLFPPPGFRTRKIWKILIAIPLYLMVFLYVITFGSDKNTIYEKWFMRIFLGLILFVAADICTSWTGIFDRLPFMMHRNRFMRYLFKFLYIIAAFIILLFLTVFVVAMIDSFLPVKIFLN
jgi:hypothetical protein